MITEVRNLYFKGMIFLSLLIKIYKETAVLGLRG